MRHLHIILLVVLVAGGCARCHPGQTQAGGTGGGGGDGGYGTGDGGTLDGGTWPYGMTPEKLLEERAAATKLVGEIPSADTAGAGTPEQLMRSFVDAAVRGDTAAIQPLMVSRAELQASVDPAKVETITADVAASLLLVPQLKGHKVEVDEYVPGVQADAKAGSEGVVRPITFVKDALLKVKIDGQAATIGFVTLVKQDSAWKLAGPVRLVP